MATRLTKQEIANGIGYKCLILVYDKDDKLARVMSPIQVTYWEHDGYSWLLKSPVKPTKKNRAGIHVAHKASDARKYAGSLCKVIISGATVDHENGARGERARLLEVLDNERGY